MIDLFSWAHNGDIFYSRMLIQQLLKNGYKIRYYYNEPPGLLDDLNNCVYAGPLIPDAHNPHGGDNFSENIFNTWIGKNQRTGNGYLDARGCCFENNKKLVMEILDYYNIGEVMDKDMLPVINFENLNIPKDLIKRMNSYKKEYRKMILISNNATLSGQAVNFDFNPIISKLAIEFPEYLFLITNHTPINVANVVKVEELTGGFPDLLYIGFISIFCDVIIGRASGPYCYTHIKENLLDKNKKFISFTKREEEGKWYKDSEAFQIWSNEFNGDRVFNIIRKNILEERE